MKSIKILLTVFLCSISLGYGQNLFKNEITGTNPNDDNPYTNGQILDANITVSGIGRGLGIQGNNGNNRYNARKWNTASLDVSNYFEFTITPNSGYEINFKEFIYISQASPQGPTSFSLRSSLDNYATDIGVPLVGGATIDLNSGAYQNITSPITFRFYGWRANLSSGTFSINEFVFNGTTQPLACATSTTWNSGVWNNGTPDLTKNAIIDSDYDTAGLGDFSACSLIINNGNKLTISNNNYVEIENNVTNNGEINVQTKGSFVQNSDTALFTNSVNDNSKVTKETAPINNWYEYTYWSSPVVGEQIGDTFFGTNADRRFSFNAANFQDSTMENMNDNATVSGQDDIDDDYNDWELVAATDVMSPGVGYAATLSPTTFVFSGVGYAHIFEGPFNNGVINTPVVRNDIETSDTNWNFIGNPYPSAIDVDAFFSENVYDVTTNPTGTLDGAIYFWSQNTAPSDTNNGNEAINFDVSDYATINGTGQIKGGEGIIPSRHIPSGQGFFASFSDSYSSTSGNVTFRNSMRVSGNNNQFFRTSSESISSQPNKLWLDLTSDNGVSSQILIGYVDGATDNNDGAYYDAVKNASTSNVAFIYSTIDDGNNKKFAIQGKSISSLTVNEVVPLGIVTNIDIPTIYSISIAQLEGDFLTTNSIILKDYLLNTVHDLSSENYTFTSDSGEFNDRFEILFNPNSLGLDTFEILEDSISIIELQNDNVKFSVTNDLTITSVKIFDVLGRELYNLKGNNGTETYKLSNLNQATYIAQIELSNGAIISKKAIKK